MQHIPRSLQGKKWAACFFLVAVLLIDSTDTAANTPRVPGLDEDVIDLQIERAIKMYFLLVTLLRKLPKGSHTTPSAITKRVAGRMDLLFNKDIQRLVPGYEADIITKNDNVSPIPRSETGEAKEMKSIREAMNLLRAGKVSKAQNVLLSKRIADPNTPFPTDLPHSLPLERI
jgi:hypothetical protein